MPTFDQSLNTRLTTDGDILTRVAGLPARVTRAAREDVAIRREARVQRLVEGGQQGLLGDSEGAGWG